ncbi:hypothetical protein D9M70_647310 [compost metagenome]
MAHRLAQFVEQVTQGLEEGLAAVALLQWSAGRAAQQTVDRGQASGRHGHSFARGIGSVLSLGAYSDPGASRRLGARRR